MKKLFIITALVLFVMTGTASAWTPLGFGVQPKVRAAIGELREVDGLPKILGTWYYVDPENGSSTNNGTSIETAVASIVTAYGKCTTGDGDGIALLASGTTSATTTSYLDTTLVWSKHGITVVGVSAPTKMFQRSRVSATNGNLTNNFADLIEVTGDNNAFYNIHLYQSADSTLAIGGLKVSGDRNYFENVHVAGSAGVTQGATCYSLFCSGAENTYVGCVFGTDTIDRGDNASCEILLDGAGHRNRFIGCETVSYVGTGTAFGAVESADASSIDRHMYFIDCLFTVSQAATGIPAMASWFIGTAPTTGSIIVKDSMIAGYAAWDATGGNDRVYVDMPTTAASGGGGIATTP